MPRQSHVTIERELEQAGFGIDSMRRARIASAIVQTGAFFGQREAACMRAWAVKGYVGDAALEAIEDSLIDGSWIEHAREMRAAEHPEHDPHEKSAESHLRHVTEANPYGWQKPELQRGLDHDLPGQWNSFRQAFNLTAFERARDGARDHRVRGCTRWEVLGTEGAPTAAFDEAPVVAARAKQQAEEGERTVYGEALQ